jgi:hypothetical protein
MLQCKYQFKFVLPFNVCQSPHFLYHHPRIANILLTHNLSYYYLGTGRFAVYYHLDASRCTTIPTGHSIYYCPHVSLSDTSAITSLTTILMEL